MSTLVSRCRLRCRGALAHVPPLRLGALGARACSRCGWSVLVAPPPARAPAPAAPLGPRPLGVLAVAAVALVLNAVLATATTRERGDLGQGDRRRDRPAQAPAGAAPRLGHAARAARAAPRTLTGSPRARPSCAPPRARSPRRAGPRGTGELNGPISHTECGPLLRAQDAVPDDRVLSKADRPLRLRRGTTLGHGEAGQSVGPWLPVRRRTGLQAFTYVLCRNSPARARPASRWPSCAWTAPAWRPRAARSARATSTYPAAQPRASWRLTLARALVENQGPLEGDAAREHRRSLGGGAAGESAVEQVDPRGGIRLQGVLRLRRPSREGWVTLHPSLQNPADSVEIAREDILHVEDVPETVLLFGAKVVWVRKDAQDQPRPRHSRTGDGAPAA